MERTHNTEEATMTAPKPKRQKTELEKFCEGVEERVTLRESHRQHCHALIKDLIDDRHIDQANKLELLKFECGDSNTTNRDLIMRCVPYVKQEAKSDLRKRNRLGTLRDALIFTPNFLLFFNKEDIRGKIFVFRGTEADMKNSQKEKVRSVICVSLDKGEYKPMIYILPVNELFNGELKDEPKVSVITEMVSIY